MNSAITTTIYLILEKIKLSFAIGYWVEIVSGLEMEYMSTCLLSSRTLSWADPWRSCAYCLSFYKFIYSLIMLIYRALFWYSSCPLSITFLLPSVLQSVLSSKGRVWLEAPHLVLSVPRSHSLHSVWPWVSVFVSIY